MPTLQEVTPSLIGFILSHGVATFGWGEAAPPVVIAQVWGLLALALVSLGVRSAVARGARREIVALLVVVVGGIAIIALFLAFGSENGLVQGRWFIAPLARNPHPGGVDGRVTARSRKLRAKLEDRAGGVIAGVAICLAVYWWLNEYRYAVDGGSLLFIGHTRLAAAARVGAVAGMRGPRPARPRRLRAPRKERHRVAALSDPG